jgi:hypothetical protein
VTVRRPALVLGIALALVYLANFRRVQPGGDSMAPRYQPFAVLHSGTFSLDPVAAAAAEVLPSRPYKEPYWLRTDPQGHLFSTYPIVTPALVLPLYIPAVSYLEVRGWDLARLERVSLDMEKLAATILAAMSGALFYVALCRRLSPKRALLLTLAYALGTGTWSISSQALWQHGTAELLFIAALLAFDSADRSPQSTTSQTILGGLACGLLVANRPPDALLAMALWAPFAFRNRRRGAIALGAAVVGILPFVVYNLRVVGNWAGGYGYLGWLHTTAFYPNDLVTGLAGLLVSPGKGLLVFSPFIAVLLLGSRGADRSRLPGDVALSLACAGLFAFYSRADWRAGDSYGPRYLVDLLPALLWVLAPAVAALRGLRLATFAVALTFSILVQAVGVFCYPHGGSDRLYYASGRTLRVSPAVWAWRNAAFLVESRAGLAPRLPDDGWPAGLFPR